jgi:hypothetical protein
VLLQLKSPMPLKDLLVRLVRFVVYGKTKLESEELLL